MLRAIVGTTAFAILLTGCDAVQNAPDEPSGTDETLPELAATAAPSAKSNPAGGSDAQAPAIPPAPPTPPAPKVAVACTASEETLFSCKTKSGNDLAVCYGGENVHYRFGKGSPSMSLMGATWASAAYSGGGEAQIRFTNGNTNYIVFSRMVRTNFAAGEPNNPAISDGVIVTRGDKVISLHECADGQADKPLDYNLADAKLARVDALFTNETGRAD